MRALMLWGSLESRLIGDLLISGPGTDPALRDVVRFPQHAVEATDSFAPLAARQLKAGHS